MGIKKPPEEKADKSERKAKAERLTGSPDDARKYERQAAEERRTSQERSRMAEHEAKHTR